MKLNRTHVDSRMLSRYYIGMMNHFHMYNIYKHARAQLAQRTTKKLPRNVNGAEQNILQLVVLGCAWCSVNAHIFMCVLYTIYCKLKSIGWESFRYPFAHLPTNSVWLLRLLRPALPVFIRISDNFHFHLFRYFGCIIFLLMSSVGDFEMRHTPHTQPPTNQPTIRPILDGNYHLPTIYGFILKL